MLGRYSIKSVESTTSAAIEWMPTTGRGRNSRRTVKRLYGHSPVIAVELETEALVRDQAGKKEEPLHG